MLELAIAASLAGVGTDPIRFAAAFEDLSQRFVQSTAVVGSPALAAETVIAQLTVAELEAILSGVFLFAFAAYTVGATGTAVRFRIRRGGLAGAVVADTGAVTGGVAAAALRADDLIGVDAAPVLPQLYSLTLQVTGATGASNVTGAALIAIAV